MTSESDFQARLDAEPDNHTVRLVFADWLQDRDDPRAEGYRALGARECHPCRLGSGSFYGTSKNQYYGKRTDKYREGILPHDWFLLVAGEIGEPSEWWRTFLTRRECEDAAALAFAKLPPERRAELLTAHANAQ